MTSIFTYNTGFPTVSTKRRRSRVNTGANNSLGKLTSPSTSLPKYFTLSQSSVSTSRPRNAITDDNKEGKKREEGCSVKRELLMDNMNMISQSLNSLPDMDDDSDSESESEDVESLWS
jgi:hypothetical protein